MAFLSQQFHYNKKTSCTTSCWKCWTSFASNWVKAVAKRFFKSI